MTAPISTPPEAPGPAIGEEGRAPPGNRNDEDLEGIIAYVSSRFAVAGSGTDEGLQTIDISFGCMLSGVTFSVKVEVRRIAELLNDVADATVVMELRDVQFWVQRRTNKGGSPEAIHGVVVDVDVSVPDILAEIERAGVPMPAAYFPTVNGYKLVYAFSTAADVTTFEPIAQRLTLAFEGGDPASWNPSQGQRLPKCLKTTSSGVVPVDFVAQLANAVPQIPVVEAVPFPQRILRKLGAWSPSISDREQIRDYLTERGIPAPEETGSASYAACPVSEEHDSKCCYVNVRDGGAIDITCLAGHGGEGKKHWSERDLLLLAGGDAAAGRASFDPTRDLPVTWAAQQLFEHKLRDWSAPLRDAAFATWMYEMAMREAEAPEAVAAMLSIYRRRLQGDRAFGPVRMYSSEVEQRLVYHDAAERRYFVNCAEVGPSTKSNLHECQSTAAWTVVKEVKKDGTIEYVPGWALTTSSLMNKSMVGQRSALRVLGVPAITRYDLPVAHVEDGWDVEPRTKVVTATKTFSFPSNTEEVPALAFFLALFHAGRLPLATENDVRLFVACIAAPLLRDIGRGQLGIFWVVGPPGAGKDFLAEMVTAIWGAVNAQPVRVSFDINITNDLEMKRSFAAAEGAVFARAKEAGKRLGMIETLIQVAGTNTLTARGMRENERSIPNSFVIVADSAEDLPDRREISRRTVMISVADIDDSISKGAVLDEVKRAAPGLLLNLKRVVETRPPGWYLGQADTRSRLLIPVALARLLGATLPEVQGQDLSDIFEAMKDFIAMPFAKEEGERERKKAVDRGAKESLEMKTLPSYRLSFFVEQMKGIAGYRELFATFGDKGKTLTTRIIRESGYAAVRANKVPYLTVQLGLTEYALKFTRSLRNFILVPKNEYDQQLSSTPRSTTASVATPVSTGEGAPPQADTENESVDVVPAPEAASPPSDTPPSFSDDDLLNRVQSDSAKGHAS